jgi:hypothetical protein
MSVLTIKNNINNVNNFISQVETGAKSYYVYVGKPDPWPNDSSPPAATDSILDGELVVYDDMVYGKRIEPDDITFMIPRYNWTSGTVYEGYDQTDGNLYTKKFYVVTDTFQVYKCIFNNYGSLSTVKPNLNTENGIFSTADGYVWKYMYTIDSYSNTKFTSPNYIPVTPNANVSLNAISGTIDFISVQNGGNNYQTYDSGYLKAYVNNYVVQLANTSSPYNNFYTNSSIYLKAGFGAGQLRQIRSYSGLSRQIIVQTPFDVFNHVNLSDINSIDNITKGLTAIQKLDSLGINYYKGYFNPGDNITQSDTGASGLVYSSNSSVLKVIRYSNTEFSTNVPVYVTSQYGTLKSGTVSINTSSSYVNAVSGTAFINNYSPGDFIRVGSAVANNIRRIVSVNSSVIQVDSDFNNTLIANVHYSMTYAANPS